METVSNGEKAPEKSKGGRPKKRINKNQGIRVRVTQSERFLIEAKAKEAGMRLSDWFRQAAKKAKVVARLNAEDITILRMLAGMANNLNQIARRANTEGLQPGYQKCMELLAEIDDFLKYLNNHDRENT